MNTMTEVEQATKEQIDGLRELAEALTSKKLGNVRDPIKLQEIIDIARKEEEEAAPKASPLSKAAKRNKARATATRLVKVSITAMAPFEKQLQGKIFDVGNSVTGQISRYVPFDTDWHVEQMLLDHIRDRQYRTKREWKDPVTRRTMFENRFHKAFGVVVLDAMTPKELEDHQRAMKAREYGLERS